jgi:hypothetical protein
VRKYFPAEVINIPSLAASSAFQLVNNSSGTKTFLFTTNAITFVRRGFSDVSAATAADYRIPTNGFVYFDLAPGEGVRVIRSVVDGVLQIGDTSK